jgi:nitronate monooxygenase
VRRLDWPAEYDERALGNSFLDTWHGNGTQLLRSLPEAIDTYEKALLQTISIRPQRSWAKL